MRHLSRSAWGLTLTLRALILRERLAGRTRDGAEIVERAAAGRMPTSDYNDLVRRLVTRAAAISIDESPLTEAELTQFAADLQRSSSFDVVLAATLPLPLRTRVAYITAGMVGETTGVGLPKVHSRFELDGSSLVPTKSTALVIVQDFFASIAAVDAGALLERELVRALGKETDARFVELVTNGSPSAASTGELLPDLALALASLPINSAARLFALASPRLLAQIATASGADGQQLFPDFDAVLGGRISGVTFTPNDAIPVDSSGQSNLVVLDAGALAMSAEPPTVSMSDQATVDLGDSPTMNAATGQGSNVTSLWQVNAQGWLAERRFSAKAVRADGVFVIENAAYGGASS